MSAVAVHRMLLRLAGRAPDRLLAEARGALVASDLQTVAGAVSSAVLAGPAPVTEADAELLAELLGRYGHDAKPLPVLRRRAATLLGPLAVFGAMIAVQTAQGGAG
jgi:hypothetical protein